MFALEYLGSRFARPHRGVCAGMRRKRALTGRGGSPPPVGGCVSRKGRPGDRRGGGVSSVFSACSEKLEPKRRNRVCASSGGAPATEEEKHTADFTCASKCTDSPVLQTLVIMKKGPLHFLGRKNQSLFDTTVKMKEMGE